MKINKTIAIVVVLFGLLVVGLGAGIWLSQWSLAANAAPSAQEDTTCVDDEDNEQEAEDEDCDDVDEVEDMDASSDVDEPDDVEGADDNEASVSPSQAGITADEAKAAAEAAYPGAKALEVELENEHGTVAYEVELDNGLEVMVNPVDGSILGTDTD